MTATWPDPLEVPVDRDSARLFESLRDATERIRNLRAEIGLQPKERVVLHVPANVGADVAALLAHFCTGTVQGSAAAGDTLAQALAAVRPEAPKAVLEDRYRREISRLRGEVERSERKLANGEFVAKAAPNVVAKERSKLEEYRQEFARVESALAELISAGDSRT
jgi:valyl-tRNA synthetase